MLAVDVGEQVGTGKVPLRTQRAGERGPVGVCGSGVRNSCTTKIDSGEEVKFQLQHDFRADGLG